MRVAIGLHRSATRGFSVSSACDVRQRRQWFGRLRVLLDFAWSSASRAARAHILQAALAIVGEPGAVDDREALPWLRATLARARADEDRAMTEAVLTVLVRRVSDLGGPDRSWLAQLLLSLGALQFDDDPESALQTFLRLFEILRTQPEALPAEAMFTALQRTADLLERSQRHEEAARVLEWAIGAGSQEPLAACA